MMSIVNIFFYILIGLSFFCLFRIIRGPRGRSCERFWPEAKSDVSVWWGEIPPATSSAG